MGMNFEINELACQCRRDWNVNDVDSIDIFSLSPIKIKNLTISFLDMGSGISGACYKSENHNVIFINSKHSKGRQAFTLAHEIYHLKFDGFGFNVCSIKSDEVTERRANLFASFLLMPYGALNKYKKDNKIDCWSLDSIIACEQYFKMSHEALLFRLKDIGDITNKEFGSFKKDIKHNARILGYSTRLYEPYIDKDNFTMGNYLKLVDIASKNDLISNGLKEELLLEAYREDIVFNL